MFLLETWLQDGELITFSELLPPDCKFLSFPRLSGKGGGLASIWRSGFRCRSSPFKVQTSFESQIIEIHIGVPILCAIIYQRPRSNNNFINYFSDFVIDLVLIAERVLIFVSQSLIKDFLSLLTTFNFNQIVSGPSHEKGHTLDLVLSNGLHVEGTEVCDTRISDHLPILFNISIDVTVLIQPPMLCQRCILHPQTASQFIATFKDSRLSHLVDNGSDSVS